MNRTGKKKQLPQKFAQNLLDYEIEYKLSECPSKQVVKSLIELYTIGVEYYQSIRSHKYLYFQIKMTEIFTSATTLQSINNTHLPPNPQPQFLPTTEQQIIHSLKIKQKQQKLFKSVVQTTSQLNTLGTIKKMINETDLKNQQTNQKVKKQIENQNIKLQQKLKKRKSRLLFSKSFSSSLVGDDTQDTLFTGEFVGQVGGQAGKAGKGNVRPIQVSFTSVINQNSSDDEEGQNIRKRRLSISQDPTKKARIQLQAAIKNNNNTSNNTNNTINNNNPYKKIE